jgi:hypothetical protein
MLVHSPENVAAAETASSPAVSLRGLRDGSRRPA